MEIVMGLIDFILHIDKHLAEIVKNYGTWTYLILFLIIFCETGLVVTPFLPGDSLLFVIGAFAAKGIIDFKFIVILLIVAAITGDMINYITGKFIGNKILKMEKVRFIKKEHIQKAHDFYEKHGGKAIILSRFVPILRTFTPFVAGIGKMTLFNFMSYNVVGGIVWILTFSFAGYFFGNIPSVKNNFTYVIFGIIFVSLLPAIITFVKNKKA